MKKQRKAASPSSDSESTAEEQPANSEASPEADTLEVSPENELPEIQLEDLPDRARRAAENAGWKSLMPVQSRAIPYVLAGRDLLVQSRTGSGKTGAFLLPILERLDPERRGCQALIMVPTRELARQVEQEALTLGAELGVRTIAVFGGVGYGAQLKAFREGAHLVIGTPGRLLDHLIKRSLSLENLDVLVLDEADHMLSMGFYPDMKRIQAFLPRHRFNAYLFSATFPPHVMRLAGEFLLDPDLLSLSRDHVHVLNTEHVFYPVPDMDKDRCLVRILEKENPASAIVFCNTKSQVNFVAIVLQRFGFDADALSSELSQRERDNVLRRVREGRLRFLVATDVAARGIDIPDLSHVIQYEPPEDPESYIHRAGRTGRAGAGGQAITLVDLRERIRLERIARRYKIDILERELPDDEEIATIVSERVTVLLESRLRQRDAVEQERLQRFLPLVRSLGDNDEEGALLALLLDDFYQFSLHAPPPQPPPPPQAPPKPKGQGSRRRRGGRGRKR